MVDSKLDFLNTSFSPEHISITIHLKPQDGQEFDVPFEEVGKKLSAVANYITATFGVRTSTLNPKTLKDEAEKPGQENGQQPAEAKELPENKLIIEGNKRAIHVFETELARAKVSKDKAAIQKAKERLERAKEKMKAGPK